MTKTILLDSVKDIKDLAENIADHKTVCYDVETQSDGTDRFANLEDWHPHSRTTCASFTTEVGEGWVLPLSHPDGAFAKDERWRAVLQDLALVIQNNKVKLVAHNAKYDVRWTYSMTGVALENLIWWDTMMADYILDENNSHRLKNVAPRVLGVEDWGTEVDLKNSEKEDLHKLAIYNARDTDYCMQLVAKQKALLRAEPSLARVFKFIGMPTIRTFVRMERTGLPLDVHEVENRMEISKLRVEELGKLLMEYAEGLGMDPDDYSTVTFASANAKFFQEFMVKSGLPILKRTPTGNPSWAQDVLEELELHGHYLAGQVLEYRQHSNNSSKFFVPWLEKKTEEGKLHPTFNPMITEDKGAEKKGTLTGRTSSSNPNAQQIARDKKACFGGVPGWSFVEMDYSQIELRIAAMLSKDKNMTAAYKRKEDLHTLMAAAINSIDPDKVTPEQRQAAKATNFGFLYGMSAQKFMVYAKATYKVEVTLAEAEDFRGVFFDKWPRIARWHEETRMYARKYGYVRNPIGRKRRVPDIYESDDYLVGRAERQAINARVQSFASDLMLLSLTEIERATSYEDVRLCGTVHDSALMLVREDRVADVLPSVADVMVNPCIERKFGVRLSVPLEVEAKVGTHWSDPKAEVHTFS